MYEVFTEETGQYRREADQNDSLLSPGALAKLYDEQIITDFKHY